MSLLKRFVWLGVIAFIGALIGCEAGSEVRAWPVGLAPFPLRTVRTAGADQSLRVMSFNVRVDTLLDLHNNWNFRRDLLVETIRRFDPDLLGTQECLANQTAYLRRCLPDYQFIGVGRSDGKASGEMCGVFFSRTRFDLLEHGHFWLSTTPNRPGSRSWGMFPRMVTWVKLRTRTPPIHALYLFNTHLTFNDAPGRYQQARILRHAVARIAGQTPTIITGDFNTPENTPPYTAMLHASPTDGRALVDTYRAVWHQRSENECTLHNFRGRTRGRRIDWILASADFTTLTAAIDRTHRGSRYPSDHYPVTAVLQWSGPRLALSSDRDESLPVRLPRADQ